MLPYIDQTSRKKIDMEKFKDIYLSKPGELNYVFTILLINYMETIGGLSYTNVNEMIGVLECCKLELYRRLGAPYEDKKIEENGDVYKT